MVVFARCEIDRQILFEIRFLKSGEPAFEWGVPSEAHNDLANVFLQGGSFLKESMKHMEEAWELAKDTHPHFYALYEQECLLPGASKGAKPIFSSTWASL